MPYHFGGEDVCIEVVLVSAPEACLGVLRNQQLGNVCSCHELLYVKKS